MSDFNWLDSLNSMDIQQLENALPDENSKSDDQKRYTPKFLGKGTHKVTIVEVSREVSASGVPFLQLEFADDAGSKIRHRQYPMTKDLSKFNIFYELFLRSLGNFKKTDKAVLGRLLLQDNMAEFIKGCSLVIENDYEPKGLVVAPDIEGKGFVVYDNATKEYLFKEETFHSFMEAKNFILELNTSAPTPLMLSRIQVSRYNKNEEIADLQTTVLVGNLEQFKPKEKEVPKGIKLPPRKTV
jgi:hypothetical protein